MTPLALRDLVLRGRHVRALLLTATLLLALVTIATAIIAAQDKRIAEMAAWNSAWYGAGSTTPDHASMSGM